VSALGTISRPADGGYVLHYERRLAEPATKVWAALTDPAILTRWLARSEVELRRGGRFNVYFFDGKETMLGTIRALEAGRMIEYSWIEDNSPPSVVRWTVAPDGNGCLLTLTHTLPAGAQPALVRELGGGWHAILGYLATELRGEVVVAEMAQLPALEARYEAQLDNAPILAIDGTLSEGGAPLLRFERLIDRPVAKVWAALTDPQVLRNWLGDVTVEPVVGGRYVIGFREHNSTMTGTITAFEPERLLEYSWDEGPKTPRSVARWELSPAPGGCRLVLTQRFATGTPRKDVLPFLGGWEPLLDALARGADGMFVPYIQTAPYDAPYRAKYPLEAP
jgi:uncharacterized protein YndB with AHSA1/START domain